MIKLPKLPSDTQSDWKKEYDLIMEDLTCKEITTTAGHEQDGLYQNKSIAHQIALLCKILYKLNELH